MREDLLDQINKRITLNLLIQGSAQHAFYTAHHLVGDELDALDINLTPLYDQLAIAGYLQYWSWLSVLVFGHPTRFWKRARRPGHPFAGHSLLTRHGGSLVAAAKRQVVERARETGVTQLPVFSEYQANLLFLKATRKERRHKEQLVDLAKRATRMVWRIEESRLDVQLVGLTGEVEFGRLRKPTTFRETVLRAMMMGYGGVVREDSQFQVVAKARLWPLLTHELAKGTAELVCLHGLNTLDRETYDEVTEAADRVEYELWQLQVGPELWRRFLAVRPIDRSLPETLMNVARLPPQSLEILMLAVVEDPAFARHMIESL